MSKELESVMSNLSTQKAKQNKTENQDKMASLVKIIKYLGIINVKPQKIQKNEGDRTLLDSFYEAGIKKCID